MSKKLFFIFYALSLQAPQVYAGPSKKQRTARRANLERARAARLANLERAESEPEGAAEEARDAALANLAVLANEKIAQEAREAALANLAALANEKIAQEAREAALANLAALANERIAQEARAAQEAREASLKKPLHMLHNVHPIWNEKEVKGLKKFFRKLRFWHKKKNYD